MKQLNLNMDASRQASDAHSRLLVILPAFNEAVTIGDVIQRIPTAIGQIDEIEVLVVDDGSTDNTADLARRYGARVVSHSRNMGVGRAMQTGLSEAVRHSFDVAVNIDADGQFAPEDIPKLVRPVVSGDAELVTASRFKDPERIPVMPTVKLLGNRGMSWLISQLTGERFFDVSCGFRAYSREALLRLTLTARFTYTQEMFLLLCHHGLRCAEIPIDVRGVREHGKSRVAANLFRYAIQTIGIIGGFLRDYRPSLFFSMIGHLLFLPGFGLAVFFFGHRLITGSFSPHIWSGFLASYLIGSAILL